MASPVIMPRQGQSVESCILTQWYKAAGDPVAKGDLLFAYETDKAAFEEEAAEDGILLARFFEEGDEVPVLVNVAVLGAEGENIDGFRPESRSAAPAEPAGDATESAPALESQGQTDVQESADPTAPPDSKEVSEPAVPAGSAISPRARRLACEKRVDTRLLSGSGPGGRIIERDILQEIEAGRRLTPLAWKKLQEEGASIPCTGLKPRGKVQAKDLLPAAGAKSPASGVFTDEPLSNIRKIIAASMHRSLQHSAQLTHHMGADATAMLALRKTVKKNMKEGGPNITLNDMVSYAVIRALLMYPEANAHFLEDRIRKFSHVNLGLAVDTDRGLMVPALQHADRYSLGGLSAALKELADSCRSGKVNPDLLAPEAASFTLSNLGNYGVEMFTPVLNLPQAGILGVNTIMQRPVSLPDGNFGFRPYIGLSLTYDHRAIDGGPATLFLAAIRNQIESLDPSLL